MHEKGQKNPPVQEHIAIFTQYLDFFSFIFGGK